jgi:hypothetical protein
MQISCARGVYHLMGVAVVFCTGTSHLVYPLHVGFRVAIAAESLAATYDPYSNL